MLTGMYVAMDGEGRLYAEVREELVSLVFLVEMKGSIELFALFDFKSLKGNLVSQQSS